MERKAQDCLVELSFNSIISNALNSFRRIVDRNKYDDTCDKDEEIG